MYASISTKFAKHHCGRSASEFRGVGVLAVRVRTQNAAAASPPTNNECRSVFAAIGG